MTRVLIVDASQDSRLALEARLSESNQFERVFSCSRLEEADSLLAVHGISVVLVEAAQASNMGAMQNMQAKHPGIGLVIVQEEAGQLGADTLRQLGAHAQTSRMASSMEFVSCIAKALVARLRPGKVLLEKFFPSSK